MLSLVVSTLGRASQLDVLLESLERQSHKDFEVIIVDQNDDERLLPILDQERWPYPVHRIATPGQRGLSRGRNVGVQHIKGDIVLFPDDDCWYPAWFLEKGRALIAQHACASVTGRAAEEKTGRSINGRFEEKAAWVNRKNIWTTQIEWVAFFRADALRAVNGYDEDIGVGSNTPWQANEGHDITLRLMKAGFRTWYDPSLYAFHAELNIATPDAAMIAKGRGYARGFGYVLRRHGYGIISLGYWTFRPWIRAILAKLKGNRAQWTYYVNVLVGRFEGWTGAILG